MRPWCHRGFGVDDERQGLVLNAHELRSVFGQGTGFGHHSSHPFSRIAGDIKGHGITRDLWRIHARQGGLGALAQLFPREDSVHPRHGQCATGVDGQYFGAGIRTGHQGHMQHAGPLNVSGILAFAHHKTFVLNRPAMLANEAEMARRLRHGLVLVAKWRASQHPQFAGNQCNGTDCC